MHSPIGFVKNHGRLQPPASMDAKRPPWQSMPCGHRVPYRGPDAAGPIFDEVRGKSGFLFGRGRFGTRRFALALQRVLETDTYALPLLHALALERGGQPNVAQANIPNRSIAHFLQALRLAAHPRQDASRAQVLLRQFSSETGGLPTSEQQADAFLLPLSSSRRCSSLFALSPTVRLLPLDAGRCRNRQTAGSLGSNRAFVCWRQRARGAR
jgi:hypothetical protein